MRKPFLQASLVLLALLFVRLAKGADMPFVTNPDGGAPLPLILTATNGSTAVSSSLASPYQYSIQCTSNTRYRVCATSNCVATVNDFLIPSSGMDLPMSADGLSPQSVVHYVSIYADGASTSCSIFKVIPSTLPGFAQ